MSCMNQQLPPLPTNKLFSSQNHENSKPCDTTWYHRFLNLIGTNACRRLLWVYWALIIPWRNGVLLRTADIWVWVFSSLHSTFGWEVSWVQNFTIIFLFLWPSNWLISLFLWAWQYTSSMTCQTLCFVLETQPWMNRIHFISLTLQSIPGLTKLQLIG